MKAVVRVLRYCKLVFLVKNNFVAWKKKLPNSNGALDCVAMQHLKKSECQYFSFETNFKLIALQIIDKIIYSLQNPLNFASQP